MRRFVSFPHVVSTLALLIALSGGAYAAGLVGTSQLKNGAVTTQKIHKKAVNATRLAPVVRQSILGAGLTGSPLVYSASDSGIQQVGPTNLILATLTVGDPGTYLVTGTLRVFSRLSNPGHSLFCGTSPSGPDLTNVYVETSQVLMVPFTGFISTLSPGQTITVNCHQGGGSGEITASYDLYAVRVLPVG